MAEVVALSALLPVQTALLPVKTARRLPVQTARLPVKTARLPVKTARSALKEGLVELRRAQVVPISASPSTSPATPPVGLQRSSAPPAPRPRY